ncbi:maturation protein [ssRNA phage SRR5467090_10]|uniref:Maturation protein n=1 Tax=ssRNA phage SRR5467090_10 TaxID=2786448 RepID=A0A8S5L489_9VIRU|nr:maturation protein [ssRNA phage SRR5467090_10]DAD52489.1 TPA_asm: maturation protein [ssRNA phage SRR5467090_10]
MTKPQLRVRYRSPGMETIPGGVVCRQRYKYGVDGEWYLPPVERPRAGEHSWIADYTPHAFGSFTKCEHKEVRLRPSPLSHDPIEINTYEWEGDYPDQAGRYLTISGGGVSLWHAMTNQHPLSVGRGLALADHDPNNPLWTRWYSSVEMRSYITKAKTMLSKWGLGKGGLAESVGELPDCPSLFRLWDKAKSVHQNGLGLYLTGIWGWRPLLELIRPVSNEISAFRRGLKADADRKLGTRFLHFDLPIRSPFESATQENGQRLENVPYSWDTNVREVTLHHAKVQYMVKAQVTRKWGSAFNTMAHLADVDGIPSLVTCWELLPGSFLVDYFYGVGDLIRRLQGNLLYDMHVESDAWALNIALSGSDYNMRRGVGSPGYWNDSYDLRYYYRGTDTWGLPVSLNLPSSRVIPSTAALLACRFPRLSPRTRLTFKNDPLRFWRRQRHTPLRDFLYEFYLRDKP